MESDVKLLTLFELQNLTGFTGTDLIFVGTGVTWSKHLHTSLGGFGEIIRAQVHQCYKHGGKTKGTDEGTTLGL